MNAKVEQNPTANLNPILSISLHGIILHTNEASKPILAEWGVRVGDKLPLSIGEIVQKVISLNSPEKIEVEVGNKVYLIVFHPLLEQECLNISGFYISYQKNL